MTMPNGLVDVDKIASDVAGGRDANDIIREILAGPRDAVPGPGVPDGGMPNGDTGPSETDKKRMLDAALGITAGSIDSKAGGGSAPGITGPAVRSLGETVPGGPIRQLGEVVPGGGGASLPNGNPASGGVTPGFNTRLGVDSDPNAPGNQPARGSGGGGNYQKNTHDFYQGDYVQGKGVADKDGYFDPRYHSEENIINNARNGDDAAYAKLEVMAAAGNGTAKAMLADLGSDQQFMHGQLHNDWTVGHTKSVNDLLANGAYQGNADARLNLAGQREAPVSGLETIQQSNPDAHEMMQNLADLGGSKIAFDSEGVTWVDTKGAEHRVPIGDIADQNKRLKDAIAQATDAGAKTAAADAAGAKPKK